MNDTSPEITEKINELFKEKTPLERLRMGCSMYDMSRSLIAYAILRDYPAISKAHFRKAIFIRFYGNDFDPAEKERILQHFEQMSG